MWVGGDNTRKSLADELKILEKEINRMGDLAADAVTNAVKSLVDRDIKLAEKVIKMDDEIDRLELKTEHDCMVTIALQQPMGNDLRMVGACLKIVTDLERIGDRAVDIAKIVKRIAKRPPVKPLIDIPRMAEISVGMIRGSMEAFSKRDAKLAREIGKRDDMVDSLCTQVGRELMYITITRPTLASDAANLMFISSFIERIADHATNIAERVIYMVEGRLVKIN
ncbi:MAG: phosphate signaling complex protein PhoU [Candidatus Hadarchaeales archaeon]